MGAVTSKVSSRGSGTLVIGTTSSRSNPAASVVRSTVQPSGIEVWSTSMRKSVMLLPVLLR